MTNLSAYTPYILAAFTIIAGIIGFFLKRTINRVDENDRQISEIKEKFAKKEDLDAVKQCSEHEYTKLQERMEERFDKLESEIKQMNREHITDEVFYREIMNLDHKMQQVLNYLMQKGKE